MLGVIGTILVTVVMTVAGLAAVVAVLLGLPGTWLLLLLALVIELADPLWLPPTREHTFGWWVLAAGLVLAAVGEAFEFLAGAIGAKRAGSSRSGAIGATVGGIVGAILGIAIPLPVIGSLIGAVIGTFVGAIVGEVWIDRERTLQSTVRPATGATIGRILGILSKVPIAIAVGLMLVVGSGWTIYRLASS